jgi:mRNA interferase HigB
MRVIAKRTLLTFVESRKRATDYSAVKSAIASWHAEVSIAKWRRMADLKSAYANASVVSADRVVFNIKGNDYRLVVAIDFEKEIVFIKWIGAHKDYDKINVKEIKYNG